MSNMPVRYTADSGFPQRIASCQAGFSDGTVAPARPIGGGPFWQRWQLAWAVFTGRADALFWVRQ